MCGAHFSDVFFSLYSCYNGLAQIIICVTPASPYNSADCKSGEKNACPRMESSCCITYHPCRGTESGTVHVLVLGETPVDASLVSSYTTGRAPRQLSIAPSLNIPTTWM